MNAPFFEGDRVSYNGRMGTVMHDCDHLWVTASVMFDDELAVIIQKDKRDLIVTKRAESRQESPVRYVDYAYDFIVDDWRPTKNSY